METLAPAAGAGGAPQTLAAGELVWAKAKGGKHWWPARLREPHASLVSCFGDAHDGTRRATQLRPFAHPAADDMARQSRARVFVAAVEEAHAHAVALLHADLTCACAPAPSPPETSATVAVANLPPSDFLASFRAAALDVSSVGLVDRARLKSWVRALAQGWGPAGAGYYPRRPVDDLVDKIDLDVPAGEDKDWGAVDKALERPQETPMQKKRSVASLMEKLDAGEGETMKNDSGTGPSLSGKRERKKSKYLSPPYTDLGRVSPVQNVADSPKESPPNASQGDKKALPDNAGAPEVLMSVSSFGKDIFHRRQFPKAAMGFLGFFRRSVFEKGADYTSYKMHECPAEKDVSAKAGPDVAGLVSDSCATLKHGNPGRRSSWDDKEGPRRPRSVERARDAASLSDHVPKLKQPEVEGQREDAPVAAEQDSQASGKISSPKIGGEGPNKNLSVETQTKQDLRMNTHSRKSTVSDDDEDKIPLQKVFGKKNSKALTGVHKETTNIGAKSTTAQDGVAVVNCELTTSRGRKCKSRSQDAGATEETNSKQGRSSTDVVERWETEYKDSYPSDLDELLDNMKSLIMRLEGTDTFEDDLSARFEEEARQVLEKLEKVCPDMTEQLRLIGEERAPITARVEKFNSEVSGYQSTIDNCEEQIKALQKTMDEACKMKEKSQSCVDEAVEELETHDFYFKEFQKRIEKLCSNCRSLKAHLARQDEEKEIRNSKPFSEASFISKIPCNMVSNLKSSDVKL